MIKTAFKKLDNLIIELYSVPDKKVKTEEESIASKKDYFYSVLDDKIHQTTGWCNYYYYDENKKAHSDELVYKVLATSDNKRFPQLPVLTAMDLERISPFSPNPLPPKPFG